MWEWKMWDTIAVLLIFVILGAVGGYAISQNIYQTQAIKYQCAEYDTQTGEWRWKEKTEQPDEEHQ